MAIDFTFPPEIDEIRHKVRRFRGIEVIVLAAQAIHPLSARSVLMVAGLPLTLKGHA